MPVERAAGGSSLIDVLDRILDKGIVIDAWIRVSLVGIDLITVDARTRLIRGRFGRGIADQIAEAFTVPLANLQDPSVVAFHSGVTQRVDDVASDERITPSTREVLTELGFEAFVVTPLRGSGLP